MKTTLGRLVVAGVQQMETLGATLAKDQCAGDIYFLNGSIGAGKSCLARGYLKEAMMDPRLRVSSPTFLLANTYKPRISLGKAPHLNLTVHHMDFYRLPEFKVADYDTLGLDKIFRDGM